MPWLEDFVRIARDQVPDRVREELYVRGVAPEQIETFGIGYIDKKLPDLEYPKNFREDFWDGRKLPDSYVFPLTNPLGEVKGVQFRSVDRAKKIYVDYFTDRDEAILFGAQQAMPSIWASRSIVAVEGVFDFFPVQRHYPNTVATMTAKVNDQLVRLLRRLVDEVYLLYDMDEKGRKAAAHFERYHGKEFRINIPQYPRAPMLNGNVSKDPGDLWEAWGDKRFEEFLRCIINPVSTGG